MAKKKSANTSVCDSNITTNSSIASTSSTSSGGSSSRRRRNGNGNAKRIRKTLAPRDSPPQRSSVYRGVTRHRWTGRYEAHLWDKNCWNQTQSKKGRQVYLGAYDDEEAAAHAYDLAALKYWGQQTILNFPLSTYQEELNEMEGQSKEEYIGSLRRKSSGFSRGVSKYRGVARHHHNGRWEARIGRVFGNKYLYLGTYATQEEAATAYDMAAIEYRGLNAVTNFDLSRYIKWLRPDQTDNTNLENLQTNANNLEDVIPKQNPDQEQGFNFLQQESSSSIGTSLVDTDTSSGLGVLLQSTEFNEILDRTSPATDCPLTPPESDQPRRSFPDDIQTYFACQDSGSYAYADGDDIIFGDLNSFEPHLFQYELNAES